MGSIVELIFFMILIIYFIMTLYVTKDILHPSSILKLIWIFSILILILYKNIWEVSIKSSTFLIIISGFIFFDFGYIFSSNSKIKTLVRYSDLSKKKLYILLILEIIIIIYSVSEISLKIPSFYDLPTYLKSLRYILKHTSDLKIIEFLILSMEIIGEFTFVLILNFRKNKHLKIMIIFIALCSLFLSTGRYRFLAMFTSCFFIFFIQQYKIKNKRYLQLKIYKYIFKGGIFFFFFFNVSAFVFNKGNKDFFNNFAIYFSGAIVAFNSEWKNLMFKSGYFGEYLLAPFYNILNRLIDLPITKGQIKNLTIYANHNFATNVYTLYRQQIIDFGLIGVPIAMFLLGSFFSFLKRKVIAETQVGFWTIIYSNFMFSLIISIFRDDFFQNSSHKYFLVLFLFLLFKLCRRKKYAIN